MSDDEPQCLIVGGRRGRPALSPAEGSASVHLRLPASDYDAAYRLASERRVSVPELIRQSLQRFVRDERGGVLRYPK